MTQLQTFQNDEGEGVVGFLPWVTHGPEWQEEPSRWYCHLTVAGERIYQYGCPCGTCGVVFRNLSAIHDRVADPEAVSLLGALQEMPSAATLARLAKVLPKGSYFPLILSGVVERVEPGSERDLFENDVNRLFGRARAAEVEPFGPDIPYYRFTRTQALDRTGRLSGSHQALAMSTVMPLHSPEMLNRERVEYWKDRIHSGQVATGFAVSILDQQAPAVDPLDLVYPFAEHFMLVNCLLDGHHRLQAASELVVPARILTLLAIDYSLTQKLADIEAATSPFLVQ